MWLEVGPRVETGVETRVEVRVVETHNRRAPPPLHASSRHRRQPRPSPSLTASSCRARPLSAPAGTVPATHTPMHGTRRSLASCPRSGAPDHVRAERVYASPTPPPPLRALSPPILPSNRIAPVPRASSQPTTPPPSNPTTSLLLRLDESALALPAQSARQSTPASGFRRRQGEVQQEGRRGTR